MIGSGWANQCSKELFTLGWIGCEQQVNSKEKIPTTWGGHAVRLPPKINKYDAINKEDEEITLLLSAMIDKGIIR